MKRVFPILTIALLLVFALGAATIKWVSTGRAKQTKLENLRVQHGSSAASEAAQDNRASPLDAKAAPSSELLAKENPTPIKAPSGAKDLMGANPIDPEKVRPQITTNAAGRRSYFFAELYGTNNQVVARDAHFRELLGYTKLAFRTLEGIRYYDLDDLHPEVIRSLGYDSAVLKRRLAEEFRHRQVLGAQAQFQADLRVKAAAELAEREKAAAEKTRAEAAIREAEARERLAAAAERAATNPPRERIYHRFLVLPHGGRIITNAPTLPPAQPSFPSIQPVPQ
jgi:hypothetical protein